MSTPPLLEVDNLSVVFDTMRGSLTAVDQVSFRLDKGEILGVVGESGCGKSVTARSIMRLIPGSVGRYATGEIRYSGTNLLTLSDSEIRVVRGNHISMISQDPMTSLNPVMTVGRQVAETLMAHRSIKRDAAWRQAEEMLDLVQIVDPKRFVHKYPHELSGGLRQRVMIALALVCRPEVLIADEPTTALDVTIQAQILALIGDLRKELNMGVIMITHDLGVVAECCDRVAVMYAGRKIEEASVDTVFADPVHPYTRGLLGSMPNMRGRSARLHEIPGIVPSLSERGEGCSFAPRCDFATPECWVKTPGLRLIAESHDVACFNARQVQQQTKIAANESRTAVTESIAPTSEQTVGCEADHNTVLRVDNVSKLFPVSRRNFGENQRFVRAVDGVSFSVSQGETLSLVGESGSGKSTTGRCVLQLLEPTSGSVQFMGHELTALNRRELRTVRKELQVVFQDPYASLNPRMTAEKIVAEAIQNFSGGSRLFLSRAIRDRVDALFSMVGLPVGSAHKYPHEFSGGQRQRIGIARALSLDPKMIVCDEPTSALDVSVQSKIINTLSEIQSETGVALLFISHDLSVVRHISDRVAVMYFGSIVEIADTNSLFTSPRHPYTEALLASVPVLDPSARSRRAALSGDPPNPTNPPAGCPFHTRCPIAKRICRERKPMLEPKSADEDPRNGTTPNLVACHFR